MSSKNYECKALQWDTEYFGVSSARIELKGIIDKKSEKVIIKFCRDYDFITLSNHDNEKRNNLWIGNKTSAFLADTNIQFLKKIVEKPKYIDSKAAVCRGLSKNEEIINIASKTFNHSRFFNDPMLPQERAKNIYLHWTKSAFNLNDKYFVTVKRDRRVAGYILFSFNEDTSVIELIAVDKRYQGQKVGKSLIYAMESFVLDKGIKKIRVGTQINNILAVQFYSAMGFEYVNCTSIYHLWNKCKER